MRRDGKHCEADNCCILIRLGLVFIRATGAWDDCDLNALANMWTVCCVYQLVAVSVSFVVHVVQYS